MFSRTLIHEDQTRRFTLGSLPEQGWEVRVEQNDQVVRTSRYTDWHRVERAVDAIDRETRELEAQGWRVTAEDRAFSR